MGSADLLSNFGSMHVGDYHFRGAQFGVWFTKIVKCRAAFVGRILPVILSDAHRANKDHSCQNSMPIIQVSHLNKYYSEELK